jgi:hypothetical protein
MGLPLCPAYANTESIFAELCQVIYSPGQIKDVKNSKVV